MALQSALILATLASLIDEIDLSLLAVSFMELQKLGFAPDRLGLVLMARGLASCLAGVFWGSLADKSDRKNLIVLSMSMVGICTLATPSLISMRGLMLTQILSGLFASAIAPVSQSLVSENVQETNRGFSFSILAICAGLAGSASAFLYGLSTWRFAYRMMGSLTLMLSLWILISFPADAREKRRRPLMREILKEMEQVKAICCIPTFLALLLGGVVGCIPWNALSFMMMYLQNVGFSATSAASIMTVMSVGRICGSLLGGILGDRFASLWPLHGRALVGQMSIVLGAIPLYWALSAHAHTGSSYWQMTFALFSFSLLAVWCNPGVDRPLLSELVPSDRRGKVIGWWRTVAETCGTIFGGPAVGYNSVAMLGYKPSKDLQPGNATSLGMAMLLCTMAPWAVCFCCYSAIHFAYPQDHRRMDETKHLMPDFRLNKEGRPALKFESG